MQCLTALRRRGMHIFFSVWLTTLLAAAVFPIPGRAQTVEWIRQFGSTSDDTAWGVAVQATEIYVVGSTSRTLPGQTSAGGIDAFVRKYDVNGNELWTRQFGLPLPGLTIPLDDAAYGVAADSTGVYVVGYTTFLVSLTVQRRDAFLRKYDHNGNVLWTRQFGTDRDDEALGVAVDTTGVYVAGIADGRLPGEPSFGGTDGFLFKYDANGSLQWARQFGSDGFDVARGVSVSAAGVYVSAWTSVGNGNGFILKYDADGRQLWTRSFGTDDYDDPSGVAASSTGVYVGGETMGILPDQKSVGGVDAFIRKYDDSGNLMWTRQFGTETADERGAVAADGSGVYFVGDTSGVLPGQTSAGLDDAFIRKYDNNGNLLWTRQFGSASNDVAWGVAVHGSGVYVVGRTPGILPGQSSSGGTDAYVLKLATTCTYEISPPVFPLPAARTIELFRVDAPDGCGWTAVSNVGWITIRSGSSGGGFGRVEFSVEANTSAPSRTGTITVTGSAFAGGAVVATLTFTVIQDGTGCTYSIAPTSQTFLPQGGTGTISVTASDGCTWTAVANASFIAVTSGSSGGGNGTVGYSVAANASSSPRSGTITVTRQTFTVTQTGTGLSPNPTVNDGGVVNNASFAPGTTPVAPGSIAALFGSNLNDGSSVLSSSFGPDGKLLTTLGGASVTINNIPSPLFYSTPGQLGIQIPTELAVLASATIQVTVSGQTSAPRTIFLEASAPGIFTLSQDGRGAAAVLHEDGVTPVTAPSPARPGEIVVLYATGLGTVNPPLATGAPSTGNRTVTTPTVSIDGIPGEVLFSGAAPGFVGLNQVNVRIPASTRSASNIPVVLSIGGKQSNPVTIAVSP